MSIVATAPDMWLAHEMERIFREDHPDIEVVVYTGADLLGQPEPAEVVRNAETDASSDLGTDLLARAMWNLGLT